MGLAPASTSNRWARVLLALLLAWVSACADASGRFREFEARRAAFGDSAEAGSAGAGGADSSCRPPRPGAVRGPALLAIETTTAPGVAILFFGELETPELNGKTAVKYSYRALDAGDRRTPVGEPLVVGPYAIDDDGNFEAETAESELPGRANALLPGVPITSQLTLHGRICAVTDFYCGTVTGTVSAPIQGPSAGQFGLLLLRSLEDIPARPRFGCSERALAPALK